MTVDNEIEALRSRFEKYNQSHVFKYFDEITSDVERQQFLEQLRSVNVEAIGAIFEQSMKTIHSSVDENIEPPRKCDIVNLQEGLTQEERVSSVVPFIGFSTKHHSVLQFPHFCFGFCLA